MMNYYVSIENFSNNTIMITKSSAFTYIYNT